jgi:hypothetical protein
VLFVDSDHNGRYNSNQDRLLGSFDADNDGDFSGDIPLQGQVGSTTDNDLTVVAVDSNGQCPVQPM